MSAPERVGVIAARLLAHLAAPPDPTRAATAAHPDIRTRQETEMTTTDLPTGFGRRNPHCANCGDERGGPHGHETSECRYRAGMTAGEVAELQPEERRREFWEVAIDRYLRSQGIDPA